MSLRTVDLIRNEMSSLLTKEWVDKCNTLKKCMILHRKIESAALNNRKRTYCALTKQYLQFVFSLRKAAVKECECVVCFEPLRECVNVINLPCHHMCCCEEHGRMSKKCLICDRMIMKTVVV
jgi:hypothetical protein